MNGDTAAGGVGILLCLVLVGSALLSRRLPIAAGLKMAAAWLAIFAGTAALVAWRPGMIATAHRLIAAADPASGTVSGGTLRVPLAGDGHYWVRGKVGDVPVWFLIDSGATTTALSAGTVAAAGLEPSSALPVRLQTANGEVTAARVRIARLAIGPIMQRDLAAVSAPSFGDLDVLGMNFLSGLKRWGVEDGVLVLTP